jgi:AcrR family transcriptional regulator
MAYETWGRTGQKSRTRDALLFAAREMVARGVSPTVEQAAVAAAVSRTTAYRYFPNQRALLAAAHPETGATSMLGESPPEDPAARLDLVLRAFTAMVVETEAQQRTMLRLSLEEDPEVRAGLPLRQGRAIAWITEALEPLGDRLGDDGLRRLVLAVRSAVGIEALAWLTDVGGLSRAEAVEVMRWSGQGLLHAALAVGSPPGDDSR